MQKGYKNKAMQAGGGVKQKYFFPEYGASIMANSQEEALKKAKQLKADKLKKNADSKKG